MSSQASQAISSYTIASDYVSTVNPTATALPLPVKSCGTDVSAIPNPFPACAVVGNNGTLGILDDCCNGAPRVIYSNGCNLYCEARNQSTSALTECISNAFRRQANGSGILVRCNRVGISFSSVLPANTEDPATRSTPTSGRMDQTSTATSAAARTSTGAAVANPIPAFDRPMGVTIGAWATMAILGLSGLASILL